MRLFGTDGVRGRFGEPPLDGETVPQLAASVAAELERALGHAPRVLVGGDTRASTPILAGWIQQGLMASGAEMIFAGTAPTPALAFLTQKLDCDAGIAVSASHNPAADNGIKLIDKDGYKWEEAAEARLEAALRTPRTLELREPELDADPEYIASYVDHLVHSLPSDRPLDGLKIALDPGNGAASSIAPLVFERLGARVEIANNSPDGSNINAGCGSTSPSVVAELTATRSCHLGAAFDGDADRVILADERGVVHDGDAILFLWACDLAARQLLEPRRIVATTMSNLGLERALERYGIGTIRCGVGDRVVVDTMRRQGIRLGGEQSGHIINLLHSTTGDGLLTALQVAFRVVGSGLPLSQLAADLELFPQLIKNVRVRRKPPLEEIPGLMAVVDAVRRRLGAEGRVVLRFSGTEPLARIMIEGSELAAIEADAAEIAAVIEKQLGVSV